MIEPGDPRHGTPAGHQQGCRETCCVQGKYRDWIRRERLRNAGHEFTVAPEPTRRKIQALAALGWTYVELGQRLGVTRSAVSKLVTTRHNTWATTAERVDRLYHALEMQVPEQTPLVLRWRRETARRGWLPPLAYDDIDAGIVARPEVRPRARGSYDEVAVDYALQYRDFTSLTTAERREVHRRWTRSIGTEQELCALTGWRAGRYGPSNPTTQESAA